MEEQSVQEIIKATHWPRTMAATALGVLALFLLVATLSELKSYSYIGSGVTATNTISVSGEGYVFAVPDTALFSVTVQNTAKDVKTAQDATTKQGNDIIAYLKLQAVDEKDIQTTDYSVNPQYEWSQGACPQAGYCPNGKQILTGYQVSETLSVKVRDTTKAGMLLSGVGSRGATQVSGLSFIIDNEDAVKDAARDQAIAQAKSKAEVLAKSLGVSLVRVVGFSEGGGGRPMPDVFAKYTVGMGGGPEASPAPNIPVGQNKIVSDVNIMYEIR